MISRVLFSFTLVAVMLWVASGVWAGQRVDFVRDVRPVFELHCYPCHAGTEQESGLRLDVREAAMVGGDNHGPDIVPGKSSESPLIRMITSDDDESLMPPDGRMSDVEVEILRKWIDAGAPWPDGVDRVQLKDKRDHWSFKPVSTEMHATSIDEFIEERLAANGLEMSPPADDLIWLRRVTFDLTGLPPTPEEVRDFQDLLAIGSSSCGMRDAYTAVVDRLLASPRYGERWAQHWLDVVRYADTHGFEVNTERPNAWPYRDYVIDALNRDTPYDQFIKEQIVGDALGRDAATGFLITASVLLPGQIGKDEPSIRLARQDALDEIVNNISQTFLGLSVGCARCHDHKFDPISARDYYAMQAFVAGVEYADREMAGEETQERKRKLSSWRAMSQAVQTRLDRLIQQGEAGVQKTDAKENVERFEPIQARVVRFTIHDANLHPSLGLIEPCIDEFEIFATGDEPRNVALATFGTKVTASGSRESAAHKLQHINDGQYGNSHSWMSDTKGRGWVQFEFPETVAVNRIVWSRDRLGRFQDRLPTVYTIEAGLTIETLSRIAGVSAAAKDLHAEKARLEKEISGLGKGQPVFAGKFRQPDEIRLLLRGDPEQPRELISPAVLTALGDVSLSPEAEEQDRRRALAQWIANPQNPLTARVMVNRIWQGHFGAGLVETPSDLGNNGAQPTHPQLLDWLAGEFVRSGWSMKHMHRMIVLSRTYRQSAESNDRAAEIDAGVRLLWRFPSRRLEAECIRDSMLAISGKLNLQMGGRGFDFFDKRGGLSGFQPVEELSPANQRRMIYAHKVRRESEAVFGAFDCPDAGQSAAVRRVSTTPIQALNLLNSRFTVDVSRSFAERIERESGDDLASQIKHAYELALGRLPSADEVVDVEPMVREFGIAVLCRALMNSNEFLFVP
ncbi:PSD1 and planctomycete cytochrome C domain-containing protein [Stieleria varia]|uniref:Planctomycete cytochrome C n=1 Tax=Stieleria varia TaxID=2528005 RepID=A0A5C6A077_9BACT|nr:PSD1 and planctomycete cytochrome C domain-containing protein [Stieleria varia]TWT93224.1 Planctomycete cytochrome C [Stieleria varia]